MEAGSGIQVVCNGGVAEYSGFLKDPDGLLRPGFVPRPGDVVRAWIRVSPHYLVVSLTDLTQNQKDKSPEVGGGLPLTVVDGVVGDVASGVQLPVPDFGRVQFNAAVEGTFSTPQTPAQSGATRVNLATTAGVTQVSTVPLGVQGNSFAEEFRHS
jgi:hypothetical protein